MLVYKLRAKPSSGSLVYGIDNERKRAEFKKKNMFTAIKYIAALTLSAALVTILMERFASNFRRSHPIRPPLNSLPLPPVRERRALVVLCCDAQPCRF